MAIGVGVTVALGVGLGLGLAVGVGILKNGTKMAESKNKRRMIGSLDDGLFKPFYFSHQAAIAVDGVDLNI